MAILWKNETSSRKILSKTGFGMDECDMHNSCTHPDSSVKHLYYQYEKEV